MCPSIDTARPHSRNKFKGKIIRNYRYSHRPVSTEAVFGPPDTVLDFPLWGIRVGQTLGLWVPDNMAPSW